MKYFYLLILIIGSLSWTGCLRSVDPIDPNDPNQPVDATIMTELVVDPAFDYATTKPEFINVSVLGPQDQPVDRVFLKVYTGDPELEGQLLATGQTDAQGSWEGDFVLPPHQTELLVKVTYPGIPDAYLLDLESNSQAYVVGGSSPSPGVTIYEQEVEDPGAGKWNAIEDKFTYMGGYNSDGVPNYLTLSRDVITQDLLDVVSNSLPEGFPVPSSNPQYIADSVSADTRLRDSAEVWVTFVHEGAGYKNVLGYYTYDLSSPPETVDDIDSLYVIFPNVSFSGSGGGMTTGDKVYLGAFSANTGIGWFLIPNGWSSSRRGITLSSSESLKFSNKDLNTFTSAAYRSHTVLLKSDAREILLLGLEDIDRPGGDNDFNDAVFYVTASPYTAIITESLAETQTSSGDDDDNDEVINANDAYPNDPDKAFDLYFPGENAFGTVAYEDLWPFRGDYDFNDVVVDYRYQAVANTANRVTELKATFVIKALGGGMSSGFGFSLDVDPSVVSSVTGYELTENEVTLAANGLESGQSKAVVIVFDNGHTAMGQGAGRFVNTETSSPYITPDTVEVVVSFATPQRLNDLGGAPFNPFIFTQRGRGYEIHLPNYEPTDLADANLFQTGNDDTQPGNDRYYKDVLNLPWAIHVPSPFNHPIERIDILQAHLKFGSWATSSGTSFTNWYESGPSGYRNTAKIYRK